MFLERDSWDVLGTKKETASEDGYREAEEQGERRYSLSQEMPQMFSDSGISLLSHQCLLLIWKSPYSVLPLFFTVACVSQPLLWNIMQVPEGDRGKTKMCRSSIIEELVSLQKTKASQVISKSSELQSLSMKWQGSDNGRKDRKENWIKENRTKEELEDYKGVIGWK